MSAYPRGDAAVGTLTGRERLGARQPVWEDFSSGEVNPLRSLRQAQDKIWATAEPNLGW